MEYRNAKYINSNGWIDCEINHPEFGWIPYTLNPTDKDKTIDNDELLALMEANGDVSAYVPPTQEELDAKAATAVREERNYKLKSEVDPVVSNPLRWASMATEEQDAVATYRQALLDITDQAGFPYDITWPTKPDFL